MEHCLTLKKSNCKNCHKCIRHCPVKSIRFSGGQANIIPDECKILPKFGVYASDIYIDGRKFRGITNIGVKPSVGDKEIPGAETLIFDFNEDIYDKIIKVELLDFIREERKMGSLKEVKKQVEIDSKRARCL